MNRGQTRTQKSSRPIDSHVQSHKVSGPENSSSPIELITFSTIFPTNVMDLDI